MQAIRLALIEYVRSTGLFGLGRLFGISRHRGGRDLISLTLLCAIIIALMAFSHSAGRGVAENVTQALLGHVRGAGTPIWVRANIGRDEGLDGQSLQAFGNGGGFPRGEAYAPLDVDLAVADSLRSLSFYPVTEIESGDPLAQLPTEKAWRDVTTPGETPVGFRGWGVDSDNPVIAEYTGQTSSWRTVVLNKKLFREHFDFPAYREFLARVMPKPMSAGLPENLASPEMLKEIYLSLPFNKARRRLVRFDIVWAETLPALQKISMLMSYEPIMLAREIYENERIAFVLDDDVDEIKEPYQVLERLSFLGTNRAQAQSLFADGKAIAALGACLGESADTENRGSTIIFNFREVVPWAAVVGCLEESGLNGYREIRAGFEPYPKTTVAGRYLEIPCRFATNRSKSNALSSTCELVDGKSAGSKIEKGTVKFSSFPTFRTGLVFVPGQADVAAALENVKHYGDKKGNVFLIGENYQDALGRMDYTQKVIGYLTLAVGGLGLLLCGAVLGLQIRPLLIGRTPMYGLLLARGINWRSIYAGVSVQILLAVVIGAVFAVVLVFLINYGLEAAFGQSTAAATARRDFGLAEPRLVPLPVGTDGLPNSWFIGAAPSLSLGIAITASFGLIFSWVTLMTLPLSRSTTPVDLIVGRQKPAPAKNALGGKA